MKLFATFICIVLVYVNANAQINYDSVYPKFRHDILQFLTNEAMASKDTTLIVFNDKPVNFSKAYHSGGIVYSISGQRPSMQQPDSFATNKNILYLFNDAGYFMNVLFTMNNREKDSPRFDGINGKCVYIYASYEMWQQFYLDYLLGYKPLIVRPVIDEFVCTPELISHKRYELDCTYYEGSKFIIVKGRVISFNTIPVTKNSAR